MKITDMNIIIKFFFFKYYLLALRSIDEEVFIFYSVTI